MGQVMSIDMLPDYVLLEIFDFFVQQAHIERWQTLVHVCRRWRNVVFRSPRRLDLRIIFSNKTPSRDTVNVWPALPLSIQCDGSAESVDNIVTVLGECSDRVCGIDLVGFERSDFEKVSAAMQIPFPELTGLSFWSSGETVSVLPDSFLGGSAPRLEHLWLKFTPFPGLPKLLSSTTHLVYLFYDNIPHSGYISPEAIVTALSPLTCLEEVSLEFSSPQSRPGPAHHHPPLPTCAVLPALKYFWFKGVGEYLEVILAYIDAPRLRSLFITLFNDIVFDTPQFTQFISRTPELKPLKNARVTFQDGNAMVQLLPRTPDKDEEIQVNIPCRELDWQVSSMVQVCTSCLPSLSMLEDLYIKIPHPQPNWQDNIENALWLELLHPFSTVKNLYLSKEITPRIVPALQDLVSGGMTEVLPTLQNIFLEEDKPSGPVQEGLRHFVAMRQDTSHPIAVRYGQNFTFDD